ncbi:uncharacterized protein LOC143213706 isoform X10 [Lasioglossum baleicum]|uniref:uncharacterized protein LOC143213706 isoform X10 n=1 Tax=Lasioglossum baleicum TaxID=434251 RepID=UPI003FCDD005
MLQPSERTSSSKNNLLPQMDPKEWEQYYRQWSGARFISVAQARFTGRKSLDRGRASVPRIGRRFGQRSQEFLGRYAARRNNFSQLPARRGSFNLR